METIKAPLEDIQIFHHVATELSFTRAAERLRLSKSQISKSIQRLEAYYGAALLMRTTRLIALTEMGRELHRASQKITDLAHEAGVTLRELNRTSKGRLRFTAPHYFGLYVFKELMPLLARRLGELELDMDLTNEHRDLVTDDFDFAIRLSSEINPDWIARPLGRLRDVICVAPKWLRSRGVGLVPRDLEKQECLVSAEDAWNTWRLLPKRGDEVSVTVQGRMRSNNYGMLRELCLEGLGPARLPYYLVEDDLKAGRLVSLFKEYSLSTHPVYLVYRRSPYYSAKHKRARDMVLEWFGRHAGLFVGARRSILSTS